MADVRKGSMNDITRGSVVLYRDQLWEVTEHLHARKGQQRPTVKAKLKNLITGRVIENQFNQSETVEFARIDTVPLQYLYRDGGNFVFMDQETFEQPEVPEKLVEHFTDYLIEGLICEFKYHGEKIVSVAPPPSVEIEVTDAPPHARGDTAGAELRPVTISTGATVKAPPFINTGDIIKIDTRTGDYSGRVKN